MSAGFFFYAGGVPPEFVPFAKKHPFAVVDHATGAVLSRFTNAPAAIATAKAQVREYPAGLDVTVDGHVISRSQSPFREPEDTLP